MRTAEDIQRYQDDGRRDVEIQGLPIGYISGGTVTLNETDGQVTVGPIIANVYGKQVILDTPYTITDGDFMRQRLPSTDYWIYLDDKGAYHVDALEPEYNVARHADYHPEWGNYRNIGKLHTDNTGIIDNAFTTTKIAENGIVSDHLSADSVTSEKIIDEAVGTAQLAALAVEAGKIAANAVTTTKIAESAVEATKIAALAVEEAKIAASAVTEGKIAALAVTTGKIDALAVTAEKIAANAVVTDKLDALAVTADKIAANAVTTGKINALAVVAEKIAADAVTSDKIIANAILAGKIAAGAVETDKLAANAVTAPKIGAGEITAREIAFGTEANDLPIFGNDDPAAADAELFDLSQPDCISNKGTLPNSDKSIIYAPAESVDEKLKKYQHPWSPRMYGLSEAIFAARTNIVKDPEDLTTANWTANNATPRLSDLYWQGRRFTRVLATAANGQMQQTVSFTGDGIKSVQCVVKKGDDPTTLFFLWDTTSGVGRFIVTITWATQTLAQDAGTLHDFKWIDSETVWIAGISTSVTAANTHILVGRTATNGKFSHFTAFQAENAAYPSPYIDKYRWPTQVRPAVSPNYAVTMPGKFVFKIKLKPWFVYNTGTYHRVFSWRVDATHYLSVVYHITPDKFYVTWRDGGTERQLATAQFDDGTSFSDINSEIILFGAIDPTTQTGNNRFFAIVAGTKQAEATNWGGAPDAKTSTFPTVSVAQQVGADHVDSLIHSAQYWNWDGSALGTLNNETDIDTAVASLSSLFSWEGEDYDTLYDYQPVSKQGAVGLFGVGTNLSGDPEDLTLWAATNATPTLSDFYLDGKRFTKVLATAANGYMAKAIVFTGNAVKSVQVLLRRGDDTITDIILRDTTAPADRLNIRVTWATKAFTETTGSVFASRWLSDDLLWVAMLTTSVTAANTHSLRMTVPTNAKFSYFTAVQAADSLYPAPYTPTTRAAGALSYPLPLPRKFTALFWIRPWFAFNTSNTPAFLYWRVSATQRFLIYFNPADDTVSCAWRDGGTERYLVGPVLNSAALLNQWIMVAATIDLDGGQTGSMLKVYAGATIASDKDWGAAPDAKTTDFPTSCVGYDPATAANVADSFMSDLLLLPGALLTEQQCDEHYNKTRPWYSTSEIASFNKQVRIDREGIRLHNSQLCITDWRNRQILISNRDGMKALDAAGKVIHDIPNAPIFSSMAYGGHLVWKEAPDYISDITLSYSDVETSRLVNSPVTNVDLSPYLPSGLTNVKGALLSVKLSNVVAAAKILTTTELYAQAIYSLSYNVFPGINNRMLLCGRKNFTASVEGRMAQEGQCSVPVVYNSGIPYVSWAITMNFSGMANADASYYLIAYIYLLGMTI